MSCDNCDFLERLKQLQETKPEERLYGKKQLKSHEKYSLYDAETDTFDTANIMRLYSMFTHNVLTLLKAGVFKYKWVKPSELLTATKGKIWDWSSEDEKLEIMNSIKQYGLHFPIFTLNRGILHNQIDELEPGTYENKFNSYNGNHRIDAIQSMGDYITKVLIIIIPEFCEKSCTGFKYTPIDYDDIMNIPSMVVEHTTNKEIELFHLRELEDEMKIHNIPTAKKDVWPGIDVVKCIDYQCAFRILQEFQNALEVPLTMYFRKSMNGTDFYHDTFIDPYVFNIDTVFHRFLNEVSSDTRSYIKVAKCLFASDAGTCFLLDQGPRKCDKMICCKHCPKIRECDAACVYFKP